MRVVMAAWARGLLPIKAQLLPHLNGAQRPSGLLGAVNPHSNPYNYTCKSFKGSRKGAKARDRALITAQSDHSSGRDAEKSAIHADLGTPSQGENGAEVPLQQQHSPGLAEGTPATPPQGKVTARSLLTLATTKVLTNLWPLLLVHFTCDVFVFLLHRLSHRVTNERECP